MRNSTMAAVAALICIIAEFYYIFIGKDDGPVIVGSCVFLATYLICLELEKIRGQR
jgi:hypothetical protein